MRNPLHDYRRVQRELRSQFAVFTNVHCPTCPSPCCVRPARITPTDILLAQESGWKSTVADAVVRSAASQIEALTSDPDSAPREPCEHLGNSGCSFPSDLRPFGCTTYICPIMYERMDRKALGRLKRKVKELLLAHEALMSALHRSGGARERK